MRLPAAWGFRDPVEIPRGGVTRDEVRQTLESRLVSRYTVTAGGESDLVTIQIKAKRPEDDRHHRSATVKVVRFDHHTNIKVHRSQAKSAATYEGSGGCCGPHPNFESAKSSRSSRPQTSTTSFPTAWSAC
jgi:hypothetical protein